MKVNAKRRAQFGDICFAHGHKQEINWNNTALKTNNL